jgi:hypothetical protein
MLIQSDNPIHRMREIQEELIQLAHVLAPFYIAAKQLEGEDFDPSRLEGIPAFRTPWLKTQELHKEYDNLSCTLALGYEFWKNQARELGGM